MNEVTKKSVTKTLSTLSNIFTKNHKNNSKNLSIITLTSPNLKINNNFLLSDEANLSSSTKKRKGKLFLRNVRKDNLAAFNNEAMNMTTPDYHVTNLHNPNLQNLSIISKESNFEILPLSSRLPKKNNSKNKNLVFNNNNNIYQQNSNIFLSKRSNSNKSTSVTMPTLRDREQLGGENCENLQEQLQQKMQKTDYVTKHSKRKIQTPTFQTNNHSDIDKLNLTNNNNFNYNSELENKALNNTLNYFGKNSIISKYAQNMNNKYFDNSGSNLPTINRCLSNSSERKKLINIKNNTNNYYDNYSNNKYYKNNPQQQPKKATVLRNAIISLNKNRPKDQNNMLMDKPYPDTDDNNSNEYSDSHLGSQNDLINNLNNLNVNNIQNLGNENIIMNIIENNNNNEQENENEDNECEELSNLKKEDMSDSEEKNLIQGLKAKSQNQEKNVEINNTSNNNKKEDPDDGFIIRKCKTKKKKDSLRLQKIENPEKICVSERKIQSENEDFKLHYRLKKDDSDENNNDNNNNDNNKLIQSKNSKLSLFSNKSNKSNNNYKSLLKKQLTKISEISSTRHDITDDNALDSGSENSMKYLEEEIKENSEEDENIKTVNQYEGGMNNNNIKINNNKSLNESGSSSSEKMIEKAKENLIRNMSPDPKSSKKYKNKNATMTPQNKPPTSRFKNSNTISNRKFSFNARSVNQFYEEMEMIKKKKLIKRSSKISTHSTNNNQEINEHKFSKNDSSNENNQKVFSIKDVNSFNDSNNNDNNENNENNNNNFNNNNGSHFYKKSLKKFKSKKSSEIDKEIANNIDVNAINSENNIFKQLGNHISPQNEKNKDTFNNNNNQNEIETKENKKGKKLKKLKEKIKTKKFSEEEEDEESLLNSSKKSISNKNISASDVDKSPNIPENKGSKLILNLSKEGVDLSSNNNDPIDKQPPKTHPNKEFLQKKSGFLLIDLTQKCMNNLNTIHSTLKRLISQHNPCDDLDCSSFLEKLKPANNKNILNKEIFESKIKDIFSNQINKSFYHIYNKISKDINFGALIKEDNDNNQEVLKKELNDCRNELFIIRDSKEVAAIVKDYNLRILLEFKFDIINNYYLLNMNFSKFLNYNHFEIYNDLYNKVFHNKYLETPLSPIIEDEKEKEKIKEKKHELFHNFKERKSLHENSTISYLRTLHLATLKEKIFAEDPKNMNEVLNITKKDFYLGVEKEIVIKRFDPKIEIRVQSKRLTTIKAQKIYLQKKTMSGLKTKKTKESPSTSKYNKSTKLNPFKDSFFHRQNINTPNPMMSPPKDSFNSLRKGNNNITLGIKNNNLNGNSSNNKFQLDKNNKNEDYTPKIKTPAFQKESVLFRTYEIKANIVNNYNSLTDVLIFYIKDGNSQKFIELMEKYKISKETRDSDGNTLLILAIQANSRKIIETLLSKGFDINGANKYTKSTPLHYALTYRNFELADLLINSGADETAKNIDGLTPWECLNLQ